MERSGSSHKYDALVKRFIDDEEILDVPAHGECVPLRIPEKSHAQELLDMPIPLNNRLDQIVPYTIPMKSIRSADAIARELGVSPEWVVSASQRIGLEPNDSIYPIYSLELLQEELVWVRSYRDLEDKLTAYAIGQFLGKDEKWVRAKANELGVFPVIDHNKKGMHQRYLYPKQLTAQLRHILLVIPSGREYFSVHELAQEFGQEWEWVKRRLDKSGLQPEERWSMLSNNMVDHYPPESQEIIRRAVAERTPPAGDWLTISTMARQLSKTHKWVETRIADYQDMAMLLRDDRGADVLHYPPAVFEVLQREVAEVNAFPDAGDYLTIKAVAKKIGRHVLWVTTRLPYVEAQPEKRVDSMRKVHDYYAPKIIDELLSLPIDIYKQQPKL